MARGREQRKQGKSVLEKRRLKQEKRAKQSVEARRNDALVRTA